MLLSLNWKVFVAVIGCECIPVYILWLLYKCALVTTINEYQPIKEFEKKSRMAKNGGVRDWQVREIYSIAICPPLLIG